jgi:hypothetical protein
MAYGSIGFEMQKTTVYLDPEIQRGLRTLSRAQRRPQAELIREALSQYLDRAADYDLPPWVGSWKLGPETDAATIKREARTEWAAALERGAR